MVAALALLLTGCNPSGLPKPGTKAYLDELTAFYIGLAALQLQTEDYKNAADTAGKALALDSRIGNHR